ncbi:hypothetical protein GCM10009678_04590 [Actinomadura kijaniata]
MAVAADAAQQCQQTLQANTRVVADAHRAVQRARAQLHASEHATARAAAHVTDLIDRLHQLAAQYRSGG